MNTWFELTRLNQKLNRLEKEHKTFQQTEKYKKLSRDEKNSEDNAFYQVEYLPIYEEIQEIKTEKVFKKIRRYSIPYPNRWDKEGEKYWEDGQLERII